MRLQVDRGSNNKLIYYVKLMKTRIQNISYLFPIKVLRGYRLGTKRIVSYYKIYAIYR